MKFFVFLLMGSSLSIAHGFDFKKNTDQIINHDKACLAQSVPMHKAMFYKSELCEYGMNGCNDVSTIEPFEVLCDLTRVSKCYSMKAWKSRNQYFNLHSAVEVVTSAIKWSLLMGVK